MILLLALFILILIIILSSIRVFCQIRLSQKTAYKSHLNLQEQIAFKTKAYEEIAFKINYLEHYNNSLLQKLFRITQELLVTKKIIFEERY